MSEHCQPRVADYDTWLNLSKSRCTTPQPHATLHSKEHCRLTRSYAHLQHGAIVDYTAAIDLLLFGALLCQHEVIILVC